MNEETASKFIAYVKHRFGAGSTEYIEIIDFSQHVPAKVYTDIYLDTDFIDDSLAQGDSITDIPYVLLPDENLKIGPTLILSTACDISSLNVKPYPMRVVYAPVLNMEKYIELLRSRNKYSDEHIEKIRNQKISQIFHLPKTSQNPIESIVLLSMSCSCKVEVFEENLRSGKRIFRLNDKGHFYLLEHLTNLYVRLTEDTIAQHFPTNN